jgi:1,4-dihydroxy-2-naphthoate octaprenyltransferase
MAFLNRTVINIIKLGRLRFLWLLSVALGALFTIVFAFPLTYLGFAIFGNLLSWYYTAPPVRLAYRGLGELATMTAVGFLMPAIGDFSQFGVAFSPLFLICLVPLLLYSLAFIVNVEVPDMEGDIAGGKRNFVARKGRVAGFLVIGLLCILATVFLAVLSVGHYQIDFRPALLFSFLPLLPALYGLIKRPADRDIAVQLVQINVGCFLLFILLMDAYLMFIHL